MIEESINFRITQKESKDPIIDLVIEIHIKESNHVKEFCIETIQGLDISCKDLASHKHEKLTNF